MNSSVGKNYPFYDFETTSARDVSYLDSGEEEWRTPMAAFKNQTSKTRLASKAYLLA
jgi:hypothetical protein